MVLFELHKFYLEMIDGKIRCVEEFILNENATESGTNLRRDTLP
jgi:hypothetical protein